MTQQEKNIEAETERSKIDWTKLFLISLFFGYFGMDRFSVGKERTGILKLLTAGGIGVWWIIDLFIIVFGKFKDSSGKIVKNTPVQKVCSLFVLATIAVFVLLIVNYTPKVDNETISKPEQVAEATPKAEIDSIPIFIEALNSFLNDKLMDTLSSKEIQSKLNPLSAEKKIKFFGDYIVMYSAHAALFERSEKVQNKEVKKLLAQAKNKLKKQQQRIFPLLRKEYADVWAKALWRNDIEVRAVGAGNSRLEFIGGIFARNANIEDAHKAYFKDKFVVKGLRFKRIAYLWSKNDEEYTYYSLDTPADEAIEISSVD